MRGINRKGDAQVTGQDHFVLQDVSYRDGKGGENVGSGSHKISKTHS